MRPRHPWLMLLLLAACDRPRLEEAEAPSVTALDHEHHAYFPINAGSGAHANADCNGCHGAFDTFTQFSCLGCHEHDRAVTDPAHTGVAGYEYTPTSCIGCHPTGQALDVDHARIFPIGLGDDHGGVRCAQCHVDPTSRAVLGCGDCHTSSPMATEHTDVGGYAFDARACIRCHADSQVDPVASHLPVRITAGTEGHYRASCLGCHPAVRTDKPFGADFSLARASCSACHSQSAMNDKHQAMTGYSYTVTSCLQAGCHPDGQKQ